MQSNNLQASQGSGLGHRRIRWHIVSAVCVTTMIFAAPALAIDYKDKVDAIAQPLIDDGVVVGMVVGIVKGDETQVLVYGETKRGSRVAPTADSLYEIGSISKVFTGVLLADAAGQGRVKLDDPLQKYLPEGVDAPSKGDVPITLRHLATHTSGLPRMPDNFAPADPTNPYADYHRADLLEFLGKHKLRREPGTHEYSNYGAGLLGDVLAQRWDMNYQRLLARRILKPLNMNDTGVALNKAMRARLVPGYNAALEEVPHWEFDALAGAGGISSSCNDMLKFIRANLATDDQPITLALHDAMQKQPLPAQGQAMGLGWHFAQDGITRWHNGMTGGYHGWLAVIPDHDIGVVVLANTATTRVSQFGEQVTQIAFGVDVKPPPARKEVAVDAEILKSYVGKYSITPEFVLNVTLEDDQLMVQATGQPKLPVFAESKTEFFYKIVDAQITFVVDDEGAITKLVLHQAGREIDAVRER